VTAARVLFVGIRTAGSLIHRVFTPWMDLLGLEARLEGIDLAPGTADADYRALVQEIAADPDVLGAVITSHKLAMHRAARALLRAEDPYVDVLQEVNVIARADRALVARATDPPAVEAVLASLVGDRPPPDEVLCLGAGGAGVALLVSLLCERDGGELRSRDVVPRRIVATDVDAGRLDAVRAMLDALPATGAEIRLVGAADNDRELARLAPGALVVNATGLGKDKPGSPLGAGGRFPQRAIVWDANYRGDLEFLRIAAAQAERSELRVQDGWSYFVHGWAQALTPILGRRLEGELLDRLSEIAGRVRERR
jgi:shikimate dehydrogenase